MEVLICSLSCDLVIQSVAHARVIKVLCQQWCVAPGCSDIVPFSSVVLFCFIPSCILWPMNKSYFHWSPSMLNFLAALLLPFTNIWQWLHWTLTYVYCKLLPNELYFCHSNTLVTTLLATTIVARLQYHFVYVWCFYKLKQGRSKLNI